MLTMEETVCDTYARDGVVKIENALSKDWLAQAESLFEWSIAHPGPGAATLFGGTEGAFRHDLCNPNAPQAYAEFLEASPVADLVSGLWGGSPVWFMYEQIFLKEGVSARRTPWHQDAPYLAVNGAHIAVVWITFEPLSREESLEFIRGSHKGPLFDGSRFDPEDETAPIFGHGLPRLPDIEADRAAHDIVGWAVEPGDVIVFHPAVLHGGGAAPKGGKRRTLSLRFFGEDAWYAERPGPAGPRVAGVHEALAPGMRFRHPAFLSLRP